MKPRHALDKVETKVICELNYYLRQIGIEQGPSSIDGDEGSSGSRHIAIERRVEKVVVDSEEEKEQVGWPNPRIVEEIDFGVTCNPHINTPLRVYERRNKVVQRESEVENSQREQYEGIDHEMEAGEKIPQVAVPIFQEGDEVADSLKATNVQIEEPALQIN
ncbi:hypothetical protein FNV43_RR05474 [Rhamnella rubrinervis]|uniref:Uncharacterized protein n=1 Tax=Rhamnella rubrinervis TaxID=2594499 RepID=A0A8K0HLD7_9ROSA|nr:hypothetical protein FNV43_RR05474 [Rhamnella rubrinervis]